MYELISRIRAQATRPRTLLLVGSLAALLLLLLTKPTRVPRPPASVAQSTAAGPYDGDSSELASNAREFVARTVPPESIAGPRPTDSVAISAEPRIMYSAELAVATRDFGRSRASVEEIVDRHRGYIARLRMIGQAAGSTLSATVRVPASEHAAALADLKSIGDVERDEESADEVTQQRADFDARIQNAQNAQRRLQTLLQDPRKFVDTAALQRQIAALQSQINSIEAERRAFDSRVVFSDIRFSLREVRIVPVEPLSAQLRSAVSEGLADAVRSLSSILLFLASYGPFLLLWAVILFLPARLLWRRSRAAVVRDGA